MPEEVAAVEQQVARPGKWEEQMGVRLEEVVPAGEESQAGEEEAEEGLAQLLCLLDVSLPGSLAQGG